ncbi:N-acetyltransferase [Oceanimonas sp. NS1]|nr:N-acetyltransferase [Oceanimonas sp. NS1]
MQLVAPVRDRVLLHIDLHETTNTDESEFRPVLAARDGQPFEPCGIPDGFYLVDDSEHPQPGFQQAVIAAVEQVTHIAPADENNEIIGSPVVAKGVIEYPLTQLGLCAGITPARYKTTTEVYPDSPAPRPSSVTPPRWQRCVRPSIMRWQCSRRISMRVESLSVEEVLPLRHTVLWPNEPVAFCRVAEDDAGAHFGIRLHGEVVYVASVFFSGDTARLRKFATKMACQGQGMGSVMLRFLIEHLRERGMRELWFDARASATAFYGKFGFAVEGARFYKHGVAYYRMSRVL